MSTTYDDVYKAFLNNCKVEDIELPQTNDKIYEMIHNAVLHFNNRLRDSLKYDDGLEELDRTLNDDHLLIMAHLLRLSFLENQLTYFTNLWQPFQKEIGLNNYSSQLKSKENLVSKQENKIDQLISNMTEDYM